MKKMMVLMFVLGLASASYAQGSPILQRMIRPESRETNSVDQKVQKVSEKTAQAAAIARAEAAKAEKAAKAKDAAEKSLALLVGLRDKNSKAIVGKDIKKRYDYMIAQIGEINGSDASAQSALYAVEDFASYVLSTTQADYLPMVKGLLSQVTCSVRTSEQVSLAEAVEEVNEAALQAGNGWPSAGVKPEALAFFRSLK